MVNLHCAALYCHIPCLHYAVLLLSRAILTLCLILLSQAVHTLCHMLLSHAVLTLCRTRLIEFCGINNFVILFAYKEIHKLTWISPNQRDKKKLTTFSSLASGDNPYKMYLLEEEWMLAAITALLSQTSNCSLKEQ